VIDVINTECRNLKISLTLMMSSIRMKGESYSTAKVAINRCCILKSNHWTVRMDVT